MKLKDFIDAKQKELEEKYRVVEYYGSINVQLGKNSCAESFNTELTPLYQDIKEIKLSELEPSLSVPYKPNGTKVMFNVKLPRKRNFTKKEFHVLWLYPR